MAEPAAKYKAKGQEKNKGFIAEAMARMEQGLAKGINEISTGQFSVTVSIHMNSGGISRAYVERSYSDKVA